MPEDVGRADAESGRWRALAALPLITVIPVLLFAVATVIYLTEQQQRALEREIVHVARQSIQAADFLLHARLSTLETFASLAAERDWQVFSTQAKLLLESEHDWKALFVTGADGTVHVAESTPEAPDRQQIEQVQLRSGSQFTVVVPDRATNTGSLPFLLVRTALDDASSGQLTMTAILDLTPFSAVLADYADPNWTVAVLDANRVIAGRSRDAAAFVGAPATPSLVDEIAAANENFFYALNQEGQRVYTAFSTSPDTGWTTAVGAPAHLVEVPLRRAQWTWIAGGIAAVALAALLAWFLTRNMLARQTAERRALQLEADRQSEARLTDIASHLPGVMYRRVLGPDGLVSYPFLSKGISELIGRPQLEKLAQPTPIGDLAWDYIFPEDRAAVRDAMNASAANLAPYDVETRITRPDGSLAWVRSMATTRRGIDGAVVWDGVMLDVTPLKDAEAALKSQTEVLQTVNRVSIQIASELDRDKLVQAVLDAGREVVGAEFGAFFYNVIRESGESYVLYALSGAPVEAFAGFPMPRNTAIFGPTFSGEGTVRLDDVTQDPRYGKSEPYRGMPDGHLPVRSYLATPVVSRTGEVLGGLFFGHQQAGIFDAAAEQALSGIAAQAAVALENAHLFKAAEDEIAQRKEIEVQQKMLLEELNHRVKNTLAVVLAIAHQTARSSSTMEQFGEVYRGRIMALANAHTLLTAGNWQWTSLRCLVATALEPYAEPEGERLSISGPEVTVPPKQALALSLVFHELATNASKHGALSAGGGSVQVEWSPAEDHMLNVRWQECVNGDVKEPGPEGFGSRLITMNVSREIGGSIHRQHGPTGFTAELQLPWDPAASRIVFRPPAATSPPSTRAAGKTVADEA